MVPHCQPKGLIAFPAEILLEIVSHIPEIKPGTSSQYRYETIPDYSSILALCSVTKNLYQLLMPGVWSTVKLAIEAEDLDSFTHSAKASQFFDDRLGYSLCTVLLCSTELSGKSGDVLKATSTFKLLAPPSAVLPKLAVTIDSAPQDLLWMALGSCSPKTLAISHIYFANKVSPSLRAELPLSAKVWHRLEDLEFSCFIRGDCIPSSVFHHFGKCSFPVLQRLKVTIAAAKHGKTWPEATNYEGPDLSTVKVLEVYGAHRDTMSSFASAIMCKLMLELVGSTRSTCLQTRVSAHYLDFACGLHDVIPSSLETLLFSQDRSRLDTHSYFDRAALSTFERMCHSPERYPFLHHVFLGAADSTEELPNRTEASWAFPPLLEYIYFTGEKYKMWFDANEVLARAKPQHQRRMPLSEHPSRSESRMPYLDMALRFVLSYLRYAHGHPSLKCISFGYPESGDVDAPGTVSVAQLQSFTNVDPTATLPNQLGAAGWRGVRRTIDLLGSFSSEVARTTVDVRLPCDSWAIFMLNHPHLFTTATELLSDSDVAPEGWSSDGSSDDSETFDQDESQVLSADEAASE